MKHKYYLIICMLLTGITLSANTKSKVLPEKPMSDFGKAQRIVVAEEVASIKCMWCPRGAVSFKLMKEKYPETFIGITAHVKDVLEVPEYIKGLAPKEYPVVLLNRSGEFFNPAFEILESRFLEELQKLPVASVDMNAKYSEYNSSSIIVEASSVFTESYPDADFTYAIVLIENNVKGSSPDYDQINIYAGGVHGPMGGFENLPNPVPASLMVYDDVARAIHPEFKGMPNSLPKEITAGEIISYEFSIDIPKTVINKDELEIIALLIDRNTGEICNAAKTNKIFEPTANTIIQDKQIDISVQGKTIFITCRSDNSFNGELYTIKGELIDKTKRAVDNLRYTVPSEGVYIVRVIKGNEIIVRKILIK